MPDTARLQELLDDQQSPDCVNLTPFVVESANLEGGQITLRFAEQPAFKNHFDNVQGGFAVAMVDVLVSITAFSMTGR